jgi:hypothetical protein
VNGEDGATVDPVARSRDGASVRFGQVPHDGETDPESSMTARRRRVSLTKAVEDEWQELRAARRGGGRLQPVDEPAR